MEIESKENRLAQFRARKAKGLSRKILVRWGPESIEQSFRLVEGHTFGHLMQDVLEHFGLPAATTLSGEGAAHTPSAPSAHYELRDAEGSVWPLRARIEDEVTEDDLLPELVVPLVCLVESSLGSRPLGKTGKKRSHETRTAKAGDSDESSDTASEKKKRGSKVRKSNSDAAITKLGATPGAPQAEGSAISSSTASAAVEEIERRKKERRGDPRETSSGNSDEEKEKEKARTKAMRKSESERRRLANSLSKRHSSETIYKGPPKSPVASAVSNAASLLQPHLDLAHAKCDARAGCASAGDPPAPESGAAAGCNELARIDVIRTRSSSPGRKEQQPQQNEKEERKKDRTVPTISAVPAGKDVQEASPRKRGGAPKDKNESEDRSSSNEQSESGGGGDDRMLSPPKRSGKLNQLRTHLRGASDSLGLFTDDREEKERDKDKEKEKEKERREKKEKQEKEKRDNVIVRLFSAGSERHREKDRENEKETEKEKEKEKEKERETEKRDGSSGQRRCLGSSAGAQKDEVEIPITGPAALRSGPLVVHRQHHHQPPLHSQSGPISPFPVHKSGIRLLKVDSEHCVTLPLINSEITAQKTSAKATKLLWEKPPSVVLIIKKPRDPVITQQLCQVAKWLQEERKMTVLIEPEVKKREAPHLLSFTEFLEDVPLSNKVDFIITLGGDGTILHVNSLFPSSVPPVLSFALGSLGFLTPFDVAEYKHNLACVIRGQFCLTVRQRLEAQIFKLGPSGEFVGSPTYQCMNEVVIDRGPDSHLCSLECYCDGLLITTIQADGIIISSTTGSTAYSLSAGGTMCHPIVPAICFTPICPHSLSCRPIMFPDSVTIRIQVPEDARTRGWVSFDGRTRTELNSREYVVIKISRWPIPCINKTDHIGDWFRSLCECLNWNNRQKQKALSPAPTTGAGSLNSN